LEEQTELDRTNRIKGLTAPSQQSTIMTFHAQVRGADARVRSMKYGAPVFGTKKSLGTLILRFAGHSQKTTWVPGRMVEVIHSPYFGTGHTHSLDFGTKSENDKGRMVGVIHSPNFGADHTDSLGLLEMSSLPIVCSSILNCDDSPHRNPGTARRRHDKAT